MDLTRGLLLKIREGTTTISQSCSDLRKRTIFGTKFKKTKFKNRKKTNVCFLYIDLTTLSNLKVFADPTRGFAPEPVMVA